MRIVGGQYRGKKLWAPEGKDIRPTSERAREAIFNILNSKLGGDYASLHLADVFAGTGAFGLEALSRGFKSVTLVDIDTATVQRNAKMFAKEQDKISVIRADAAKLPRLRQKFDVVFADAPYAKGLTEVFLQELSDKGWLADGALCIIEIKNTERPDIPDVFEIVDERVYGLARILFLRQKEK